MRVLLTLLVAGLLAAPAAQAQVMSLGLGAGTTWEFQPEGEPNRDFVHAEDVTPLAFVGIPYDETAQLRIRALRVSRTAWSDGQAWDAKVLGLTVGVDYWLPGTFGVGVLSGGIGGYRQTADAGNAPETVESDQLGFYLGVGEWFEITERARLAVEITGDRTFHDDHPILLTLSAAFVFSF